MPIDPAPTPAPEVLVTARQSRHPHLVPTSAQIRAARSLLGWSAAQLAQAAGVSWRTVQRAETGQGVPRMTVRTLEKIQGALERAGVRFIAADSADGPGVRLRSG